MTNMKNWRMDETYIIQRKQQYNDRTCCLTEKQLPVWHSVAVTLILINVVTLQWAQLVLGWVTICRCSPPRPTQPSMGR